MKVLPLYETQPPPLSGVRLELTVEEAKVLRRLLGKNYSAAKLAGTNDLFSDNLSQDRRADLFNGMWGELKKVFP